MNGTYTIHRVKLEINTDDPYTPAIVLYKDRSATFDCALAEGEVDGLPLQQRELDALEKWRDKVDLAYEIARKNNSEFA